METNVGSLTISQNTDPDVARACATMMASTEPWLTLGRTYEQSLAVMNDPTREVHVGHAGGTLIGFVVLCMVGAFVGYIQSVCVLPDKRGQGYGTRLLRYAEARIFRETPNVFMCVSSFNTDAQRLYARQGYAVVGALDDYIVPGHAEILLRKSVGSLTEWRRPSERS